MSCLIVYASRNGSTEKCALNLHEKLDDSVILNLEACSPPLSEFNTIIIGSCIRFGKIHKLAREFINANLDILLQKKVAIFICCGMEEQVEDHFKLNFPPALLEHAMAAVSLGGEFPDHPDKRLDAFVLRQVRKMFSKEKKPLPHIDEEKIDALARTVCNQ